ncbi:MAG: hypothetical protein ABEI86_00920, partial [Halobacteriaceae archaeon]
IGFAFTPGPLGDDGNPAAMVLFFLIGASIVMAGLAGSGYKVIADAVATGNAAAGREGSPSNTRARKAGDGDTGGNTHGDSNDVEGNSEQNTARKIPEE